MWWFDWKIIGRKMSNSSSTISLNFAVMAQLEAPCSFHLWSWKIYVLRAMLQWFQTSTLHVLSNYTIVHAPNNHRYFPVVWMAHIHISTKWIMTRLTPQPPAPTRCSLVGVGVWHGFALSRCTSQQNSHFAGDGILGLHQGHTAIW